VRVCTVRMVACTSANPVTCPFNCFLSNTASSLVSGLMSARVPFCVRAPAR